MKILDNPVYIGKIVYGGHKTEKIKGSRDEHKRVMADDYMVVDGMHEAIISRDLWEATRLRRKDTGVKWNKTHSMDHEHILTGNADLELLNYAYLYGVSKRNSCRTANSCISAF